MNRVTINELEELVQWINELTGHNDAGAKVGYKLGGAYGGWRLEFIGVHGGNSEPLGGGYYSKKELAGKLRAFIRGLQTAQEQKAAK